MIKYIFSAICIFLISSASYSQNQNSIWCFGDSAGINFSNPNNPTTFTSFVKSRGTCCSVADSNGNLVCYSFTDWSSAYPTKVYNSNNQPINNSNGMYGGGWYTEQTIVPNPASNNQYYLFQSGSTVPGLYYLYYSTIDMSLNSGNGAVISKNNVVLTDSTPASVIAVKHGNGRDWWVITHRYGYVVTNSFYIFLVSPAGISPPVIQNIGTNNTACHFIHYNFNKTGTKMSYTNTIGLIEVFDFDRCTGLFTSYTNISPEAGQGISYPWHSCFSPNDSLLYITTLTNNRSKLLQYNLYNLPITADTLYSCNIQNRLLGFLKLAPDNKIYIASFTPSPFYIFYPDTLYTQYNTNLSVINNPDLSGAGCNFAPYSFYLGGNRCYVSLPNNPDYELPPLYGSSCDSLSTGINDIAGSCLYPYAIYPNPATSKVTIGNVVLSNCKVTVTIYDVLGKQKLQHDFTANGDGKIEIDVSSLTNGICFLQVKSSPLFGRGVGGEVLRSKFVKE